MLIFFIRYGKLTGRKSLYLSRVSTIHEEELIGSVLEQFYETDKSVPPRILVPVLPRNAALIEKWLSNKRGTKVHIHAPQKGKNKKLMLMAQKNALLGLTASLSTSEGSIRMVRINGKSIFPPRFSGIYE